MYFSDSHLVSWARRLFGLLLLLGGVAGTIYAIRVTRAQVTYHRVKFREPDMALDVLVADATQAHAAYAHNYRLSHWVAETAWYTHGDAAMARDWVERGLAQNPHHLEMRWLETVLVGIADPVAAAQRWEAYSDTVFWNRWVLAGRVYWLAHAGRLAEAEKYLALLRKVPGDYGWAEEAVQTIRSSAAQ